MKKKLLLIDGSSYLYRAFHAMPDLRADTGNPESSPTGAIRGIVNMMQNLRKEFPSDYVACIFDAKGPTFRDEWYPAYKANRSPMPDDLRVQIEPVHEVVALLGFPVLAVPGVEADDVIGTLAVTAAAQDIEVIVSSGDKDLSQLVNEHITIIDTMNGKRRDQVGVEQEFGVPARLMVDFQTLVGDVVDNVPGVPKVGPKTAAKWLNEFGSLDAVVANCAQIKGVVGENLRGSLDWLPMAKRLLTVKTDCDLTGVVAGFPSLSGMGYRPIDRVALAEFYQKYGFKGLYRALQDSQGPHRTETLGSGAHDAIAATGALPVQALADGVSPQVELFGPAPTTLDLHYETILDWPTFDTWLDKIKSAAVVALDTETTSLVETQATLVGISFCIEPGESAYLPLMHRYPGAPDQLPLADVLLRLKPYLEDPIHIKLGQHIKYDRHVFANHAIEVKGYAHDTMLQSYVIEAHKPHNLASLAERHLHKKGTSYEDLCGKGAHQIGFDQVDMTQASRYACEDADFTLQVHRMLWPYIQAHPRLTDVYALEIASSEALFRVEQNGVLIDGALLAVQSHALGARLLELESQAHELAGQVFSLSSPKQIGELFFGKLGLPVVKKTATGVPSTDEEVLEKLAQDFPLPAKILEHRGLAKLKGTYTDKLALLTNPTTGRVHTHYAQAVAVTGRLSSQDPNLQNIPIRTPEGRRVREAFVAQSGCRIASADYSQIELRIMAHLSDDPGFLLAFREGLDIHRATAAEVFNVGLDQVSTEQRRYAKVINFGLIYGMSAFGLARNLGLGNTEAKNYIERYFARYPGVRDYMEHTKMRAKSQGYVETVMGRRLYLPEINSPNGPRRAAAERAAINAPMQGTAADLIKLSMVHVQAEIDRQGASSKIIMQVHDELVFEVPSEEVSWLAATVPRLMAAVANLKVPLVAEVGVGDNWDQAH